MEHLKIIAHKELDVLGGKPDVTQYWDENNQKSIDILVCADRPIDGVQSCATIGLSEIDIDMESDGKDLRIELLGACDIQEDIFPNIIATVAFEIMDKGECLYGDIIENVISEYVEKSDMKHVFLTSPFLWEGFDTLSFEDKNVAWLLVVPISDREKKYANAHGIDALETLFDEKDIDIYDLYRDSVI